MITKTLIAYTLQSYYEGVNDMTYIKMCCKLQIIPKCGYNYYYNIIEEVYHKP